MTHADMTAQSPEINDCWNRIGVRGDHSCPKLVEHIHCRNCDVHAIAAQTIMQRRAPENYRREWSDHFAQVESVSVAMECSVMAFRIGKEWLALPTRNVVLVAEVAAAHSIPHRSDPALKGLVNINGTLYPCMSLAALVGIDRSDRTDARHAAMASRHSYARLVVVDFGQQKIALSVDDVRGIVHYGAASLSPAPAKSAEGLSGYLLGVLSIGDMCIGCLDAELLGYKLMRILQ